MSWEHELARKIKGGQTGPAPSGYLLGTVLSPPEDEDEPLIISILGGNAMLTEEMVDLLSGAGTLQEGQTVALLPGAEAFRGGQRFLVLGVIGDAV